MNLKRALWVGLLTYVVSLLAGMLVIYFSVGDLTQQAVPNYIYYISIVLTMGIGALFTLLYLKDKKIAENAKEGFYFGLVLIILGTVIDAILFAVGGKYTGSEVDMITYYSSPTFLIALVLFLATTTLVGWAKGLYVRRKMKK